MHLEDNKQTSIRTYDLNKHHIVFHQGMPSLREYSLARRPVEDRTSQICRENQLDFIISIIKDNNQRERSKT